MSITVFQLSIICFVIGLISFGVGYISALLYAIRVIKRKTVEFEKFVNLLGGEK